MKVLYRLPFCPPAKHIKNEAHLFWNKGACWEYHCACGRTLGTRSDPPGSPQKIGRWFNPITSWEVWGITIFATSKQEKWANDLKTSTSWTKSNIRFLRCWFWNKMNNPSKIKDETLSEACIWASEWFALQAAFYGIWSTKMLGFHRRFTVELAKPRLQSHQCHLFFFLMQSRVTGDSIRFDGG